MDFSLSEEQLALRATVRRFVGIALLGWRAAVNADRGLTSILDSSSARCFANQIARPVTGHALHVMGGYGYSTLCSMERRMRDAWGWGIAGGAMDIQKVNIASALIGRRFNQRR